MFSSLKASKGDRSLTMCDAILEKTLTFLEKKKCNSFIFPRKLLEK